MFIYLFICLFIYLFIYYVLSLLLYWGSVSRHILCVICYFYHLHYYYYYYYYYYYWYYYYYYYYNYCYYYCYYCCYLYFYIIFIYSSTEPLQVFTHRLLTATLIVSWLLLFQLICNYIGIVSFLKYCINYIRILFSIYLLNCINCIL